jgi:GTP-binding protein HflX
LRLEEACGLADALDLMVVHSEVAPLRAPAPGMLFGSGRVETLKTLLEEKEAGVLVVDATVSPVQQRNLEKALNAKVIDRTGLILEIFGRRAQTREGRLQVELARLGYEKSRLVRTWTHLERQRGGLGKTGGPGETQLETDRRLIARRILKLEHDLEDVRRTRALQRGARRRAGLPAVVLVGYTNAGKSSLFNRLTAAGVLAKDMPFATLDPTARLVRLPSNRQIILADTVGFISDLPTELVAAFRATLEAVTEADVLVHVRDVAHPETEAQREDVEAVLERLATQAAASAAQRAERKAAAKSDFAAETAPETSAAFRRPPLLEVWNKVDLLDEDRRITRTRRAHETHAVMVSALTGEGMDHLLHALDHLAYADNEVIDVTLDVADGGGRAWLAAHGRILEETMSEEGALHIRAELGGADAARFRQRLAEAGRLS